MANRKFQGEEFLAGSIPSRTDPDPCNVDEKDLPTWADVIFILNNNDVHLFEVVFVGCDIASDPETQAESGLGGWSGVVAGKEQWLRVPFGPGIAGQRVSPGEAIAHSQDPEYTVPFANALDPAHQFPLGGTIVGIVIRKLS